MNREQLVRVANEKIEQCTGGEFEFSATATVRDGYVLLSLEYYFTAQTNKDRLLRFICGLSCRVTKVKKLVLDGDCKYFGRFVEELLVGIHRTLPDLVTLHIMDSARGPVTCGGPIARSGSAARGGLTIQITALHTEALRLSSVDEIILGPGSVWSIKTVHDDAETIRCAFAAIGKSIRICV